MRWTRNVWLTTAVAGLLLTLTISSQTPAPSAPVVVLDAAHGGADSGASLPGRVDEKDVTQQLAQRLRALLQARGFDVRMLRDGNSSPTPDERAGQANTAHAMVCISLHATAAGTGVHTYASMLSATDATMSSGPIRWESAQSPFVERSMHLQTYLSDALTRSGTANFSGRTWLSPLNSMQCPALVVELAPLGSADSPTPVTDSGYQQRVADAIAGTLLAWRNSADAVVHP